MTDLVSIIMPNYNGEKTICQAIESVLNQTYQDWELIIVDDRSTDRSREIIQSYVDKDSRIKSFQLEKRSGSPVEPTNRGIQKATGRYIAFLDSDDQWLPKKLEEQLPLFHEAENAVVYSNYEKINASGERAGRIVTAPESVSYKQLLRGNVIGNLTGVYDTQKVGKVYVQNIGHQDYVLWLSILKKGFVAKNTNRVHGLYRSVISSVSSNKIKAMKWTWHIYIKIEKLPFPIACFYFLLYAVKSTCKFFK